MRCRTRGIATSRTVYCYALPHRYCGSAICCRGRAAEPRRGKRLGASGAGHAADCAVGGRGGASPGRLDGSTEARRLAGLGRLLRGAITSTAARRLRAARCARRSWRCYELGLPVWRSPVQFPTPGLQAHDAAWNPRARLADHGASCSPEPYFRAARWRAFRRIPKAPRRRSRARATSNRAGRRASGIPHPAGLDRRCLREQLGLGRR